MIKKRLSIFLAAVMLIGCLPALEQARAVEVVVVSSSEGYREEAEDPSTIEDSGLTDALGKPSRYSFGKGDKFIYTPDLPEAGDYEVFYYVIKHETNDSNQKVIVNYSGGQKELTIDCVTQEGWVSLGTYPFEKGTEGNVTAVREGPEGALRSTPYLRAGGVKFTDGKDTPEPSATPEPVPVPTPSVNTGPKLEPKELKLPAERKSFTDLGEEYSWAVDAVEVLAGAGVIDGVGEGKYDPSASITRGEF